MISRVLIFSVSFLLVSSCSSDNKSKSAGNNSALLKRSGGDLSKEIQSASLLRVVPNTENDSLLLDLATGHSFFQNPWVKAPTATTARDGLGPLFNARTCVQCHEKGGRGRAPLAGKPMRNMLVRVSLPGHSGQKSVVADPLYGTQLQFFGVERGKLGIEGSAGEGESKAVGEARISVAYTSIKGKFPDGQSFSLKKPNLVFDAVSYGEFSTEMRFSPRVGPSLVGVGLIELIPEELIRMLEDATDNNKDGVSGRINRVWSQENNKTMAGRYGLKASTPTLRQQVADAFVNDIGITSSVFPEENCGEKQSSCLLGQSGRGPTSAFEIDNDLLSSVVNFVRYFPVPIYEAQNPALAQQGEAEFEKAGCQSCHHASFVTTKSLDHPLLSEQTIWPYSDFLVHDMGIELADNRRDFEASGMEWRTAPLWGLQWRQEQGLFNNYLHDGRAATVEEAILWHGGEAELAKQRYMQLSQEQRKSLLYFVRSL